MKSPKPPSSAEANSHIDPASLYPPDYLEWIALTPAQRLARSAELWDMYLLYGGSLDADLDPQSPFLIQKHNLRVLLMGGQACVLYGAAEFSKDFDFLLLLEDKNIERFREFLAELQAQTIAVPPFELSFLQKGHAVHFRAQAQGLEQLRIDVMSNLRGVDPFPALWARRTTAQLLPTLEVNLLSLPDLVQAKKTQRDKDLPMIRRLVDTDYLRHRASANEQQAAFWLRELRTPELLIECVANWSQLAQRVGSERSDVIYAAMHASRSMIEAALSEEAKHIRELDRAYWAPLIEELEQLRHARRGK